MTPIRFPVGIRSMNRIASKPASRRGLSVDNYALSGYG